MLTYNTPASLPLHKDQQLDDYPQTKAALEEIWSSVRLFQEHSGTKNLRITTQGEGRLHFARITSSSKPALLSVKRELPGQKEVPWPGWKSNQLLQSFGVVHENPMLVSSHLDQQS